MKIKTKGNKVTMELTVKQLDTLTNIVGEFSMACSNSGVWKDVHKFDTDLERAMRKIKIHKKGD